MNLFFAIYVIEYDFGKLFKLYKIEVVLFPVNNECFSLYWC